MVSMEAMAKRVAERKQEIKAKLWDSLEPIERDAIFDSPTEEQNRLLSELAHVEEIERLMQTGSWDSIA
ncbi:MAG TPA: hypothetical protein GXX50_10935 [Firmicutes bacterium]|nr:hypothetical protein [Bacillota bacterium]